MGSVRGLERAIDAAGEVVDAVAADQWGNGTPCADWNVRALVNHVVFGQRTFASILRSEPPPSPDDLIGLRAVDQLGDDPAGAFHESAAQLLAAFRDPNVLENQVESPIGPIPGAVVLDLRITELLVHGWDLAQATGQEPRLPHDVAEQALAFSRRQLDNVPRAGRFGEEQPVADDAPAATRLAAYLGRAVTPDARHRQK